MVSENFPKLFFQYPAPVISSVLNTNTRQDA